MGTQWQKHIEANDIGLEPCNQVPVQLATFKWEFQNYVIFLTF